MNIAWRGIEGDLQPAQTDEHGREPEARSEGRPEHGRGEHRVAAHPRGQEVRLVLVELLHKSFDALRGSLGIRFVVWRLDDEG